MRQGTRSPINATNTQSCQLSGMPQKQESSESSFSCKQVRTEAAKFRTPNRSRQYHSTSQGESIVLRFATLVLLQVRPGPPGGQDRFFRHVFRDVQMSGLAGVARSEKVIFVYRAGLNLRIETFLQVSFQF